MAERRSPRGMARQDNPLRIYPGLSSVLRRDALVQSAVGGGGRLKHVILHPETREVTDLVVAFEGRERQVPLSAVSRVDQDRIVLRGAWSQYGPVDQFEHDRFHAVDPQRARLERAEHAVHGGSPLLDAGHAAVRIPIRSGGAASPLLAATETEQPVTPGRPYHFALREERLQLEGKSERAALLRVSRRKVERIETIEVPIVEERVTFVLAGDPGERAVTIGDRELRAGETVELTLATERVCVTKQRVTLEDVSLRKETVESEQHIEEKLRREILVVDDPAKLAVEHVASRGTPKEAV
jgi:uncharacterized protein (TIGR02271 family)